MVGIIKKTTNSGQDDNISLVIISAVVREVVSLVLSKNTAQMSAVWGPGTLQSGGGQALRSGGGTVIRARTVDKSE